MRTPQTLTLPIPAQVYEQTNETLTRRTIEQHFQDLRADLLDTRQNTNKEASLATRRHQFLLMGA